MALKQIKSSKKETDMKRCPKCGEEAIIIDGRFVRWLNCPNCKFKKLLEKEDETTNIKVKDL
jgi:ssDNA-binding Zn-finger/Zn-ribbon topoisomerase 1